MDGSTFATSTTIATNSDGTGYPLSGTYSDGSTYRSVSSTGGLGSGGNCAAV